MSSRSRIAVVRNLSLVLGLSVLLAFAGYSFVKPAAPPEELLGVLRQQPRELNAVSLLDQKNDPFGTERLAGKWSIVFFGYLSCPDICPTTLYLLKTVTQRLRESGSGPDRDPQIVFVSVDPNRDSPDNIAAYLDYFSSSFVGVTGSKEEIDQFASQFNAGYLIEPEHAPGQYHVAHTSALFLVDPEGRVVASFSQPHDAETIVSQYEKVATFLAAG